MTRCFTVHAFWAEWEPKSTLELPSGFHCLSIQSLNTHPTSIHPPLKPTNSSSTSPDRRLFYTRICLWCSGCSAGQKSSSVMRQKETDGWMSALGAKDPFRPCRQSDSLLPARPSTGASWGNLQRSPAVRISHVTLWLHVFIFVCVCVTADS